MNVDYLQSGRTFVDDKFIKTLKEKESELTKNLDSNKKRIDYLKLSNSFRISYEKYDELKIKS